MCIVVVKRKIKGRLVNFGRLSQLNGPTFGFKFNGPMIGFYRFNQGRSINYTYLNDS